MKKIYILFAVGLLVCANLYASNTKDVTRKVVGQGNNRNEAIRNALFIAVSQVRGVQMDSGASELGFSSDGVEIDSGQLSQIQSFFYQPSASTTDTAYTTETVGFVKTYRILEEKKIDDNTYQVKLEVKVYDYAPREGDKRPKIAIMPIKSQTDNCPFSGLKLSPEEIASLLSQRLTIGLTQTRKFAVLDRESMAEFARERKILLSEDAPLGEKAKLSEALGADYLLVGDISLTKLKKKAIFLKTVNCTKTKYKMSFVFNYRIVSGLTRQVIFADVAVARYQSKKLSAGWRPKRIWDTSIIDNSINDVVEEVVEKIVDKLCLMRVVSVQQDDIVIISKGSDKISEGMWLDIFVGCEEFFDYETGESLGKDEKLVAKAKVKKVKPKIIYAKVIHGDVSKISKGLICRVGKAKKDCRLLFHVQ
jgi:curli biogenesis system outer membrane secretion channel CsgG